jgi:anti-sigma factor ChrR (cupin superfamily)
MLSCKEATRLLSQAQDRRLTPVERIKLALHVVACTACKRFARQLALIRGALARMRT